MKDIRKGIRDGVEGQERAMQMIASGLSNVADKVSGVADELSNLAGIVQGGFDELNWELQQQTQVLLSIDQTLKTPSQTQAREWREMAEQLRKRDCFDEAEEWFLKSLKMSPLDYRTYIGLAFNYLRKNDFDKAEEVLTRSFPHAPQGILGPSRKKPKSVQDMTDEEAEAVLVEAGLVEAEIDELESEENHVQVSQFDYKSLSHRLIGRTCACRGDYGRAAAELRLAIELSPDYPEGNYDYALYCVQSGTRGGWEEPLHCAISARPGYLNVAWVERRFFPARQELKKLLSGLINEAYRNAGQAIHDAETKFTEAQRAVANVSGAGRHELWVKEEKITALLATAKSDWVSKDYVKILKARADATSAATLSSSLAQDAREASIAFSQEKKRRQREALKGIPGAIGRSVGLAFLFLIVGGIGGCVVGVVEHKNGYADAGAEFGVLLGIILGVIWGIIEFKQKLEGKE
jgi:tetratricopeptide (TPR) repeat protein